MSTVGTRALGIITARGGSKGIPKKNIRLMNGKPTIAYAIEAARGCRWINPVMVTTDCQEIASVAKVSGAEVPFLRPERLATDTARQEDAILHAMQWYTDAGHRFDYLCLLEPTTPLRTSRSLERGFEILDSRPDVDAVFSVVECDMSPVFCSPLREDRFMKDWMDEKYKWANRQEIPTFYQPTPVVTISRWSAFLREESFMHDKTLAMPIDSIEGRDIDSATEFFLIDQLLKNGLRSTEAVRSKVLEGE